MKRYLFFFLLFFAAANAGAQCVPTSETVTVNTTCEQLINPGYTYNGVTYNSGGTYTVHLTNNGGCDSVVTLNINAYYPGSSTTNITVRDCELPFFWGCQDIFAAGTYSCNIDVGNPECGDSIAYLVVTVTPADTVKTNVTICFAQAPYIWNGVPYYEPGSYVNIVNSNPCSFEQLNLTVLPSPAGSTSITVCANNLPYRWNGQDFFAAGIYTIFLPGTVCDSSATLNLSVAPKPIANFGYALDTLNGRTVHFKDSSQNAFNITQWGWNFGDSFTSTQKNPDHSFTNYAAYNVSHWIVSAEGCASDTITKTVFTYPYVNSHCTAAFITSNNPCGTLTTFADASATTAASGPIVSEVWNYGDGKKDTVYTNFGNITHTYTRSGIYTVTLTIFTTNCSNSSTHQVTVSTNPFAKFGFADASGHCVHSNVAFIDSASVTNGSITGYTWYFGDGGYSNLQSPVHQYNAPGTYTISQFVYSAAGCADSAFKTYTIYPDPVANFNFAADSIGSKTIHFTNLSTIPAGTINSYLWDFGAASTGTQPNPTYIYPVYATYAVSLTATSNQGCSNTIVKQVIVDSVNTGPPCRAAFSIVSNNTCLGITSSFRDSSYTSATKEIWDFGDGQKDTLYSNFSFSVAHPYSNPGSYNVSLTIFTQSGCSSTKTLVIDIRPNPVADFSFLADPTCTAPFAVQFTNTSTISSGSLNLNATTWNFDDGFSGSGADQLHSFANPGSYSVRLIMRSQTYSCRDTIFKMFTTYSKPVAAFTYAADDIDHKTIHFTDAATSPTSPVTQWFWDFGDGTTSTQQHPSHTYSLYNSYTVKHTAISAINCVADTVAYQVFTDSIVSNPSTSFESSMGKEFWAGFGYQEKMNRKSGDANEAKLSLYIAAGSQPAVVTLSLPGMTGAAGFPRTIHIMADSIAEVTGFPSGDAGDELNPTGLPDTRLFYTGISKRGIHISSNQPVGVWEHIYATTNTAGGSLLLPENVWGNDYLVQTMGGKSNNQNPNSFFFVMAKEDSTVVYFTPTADIVDSSDATIFTDNHTAANILYHAGITYTVTLNRGEVFNAMGIITGTGNNSAIGADLSGSRVKSADPLKKIAVFAGNGRLLIKTTLCDPFSGSDNLIQQMFPKTVWGTRYLTTPTKTMEYNLYRIAVADTATVVKLNGNILPSSSLINSTYYQVENNRPNLVESNKRVMVTQYIITPGCVSASLSGNGMGDPEMIILSPVKYATNNISVYAAGIKSSITPFANFINVVLRTPAVPSFRLDGMAVADTGQSSFSAVPYNAGTTIPITSAFKTHPADPNYSFARFRVATSQVHTLHADSSFTAITYGVANAESNGYNAGFYTNFSHTVYTFNGSGNWNNAANWLNNAKPPVVLPMGSEIVITGDCVLNVPQTIEDGAMLTVATGGHLSIMGDLLIYQ